MTAPKIILASLVVGAVAGCTAQGPGPNPKLSPPEVVKLQLDALRHNDPATDGGIATAFQFASPGNRAAVGGLKPFKQMIHRNYADMLRSKQVHIQNSRELGDHAAVLVDLLLPNGEHSDYLFVLRRIHGDPCDGCWMTDGVAPAVAHNQPHQSI